MQRQTQQQTEQQQIVQQQQQQQVVQQQQFMQQQQFSQQRISRTEQHVTRQVTQQQQGNLLSSISHILFINCSYLYNNNICLLTEPHVPVNISNYKA